MKKRYQSYTALVASLVFVLVFTDSLIAQPPGLPFAPEQAPLGGLGLLAAAGGAYAWNKLRNKNNQE